MAVYQYIAFINPQGKWTWDGRVPPEAPDQEKTAASDSASESAPAPGGFGKKQRPIFQRGDSVVLRVGEAKGLHKITLEKQKKCTKLPFAYPFDKHEFTYDPDKDPLIFAGFEDKLEKAVWVFSIEVVGGTLIDPEFQVGPGGITGGE